MKLLITGGAGFIGSNFIHYILKNYPEDEIVNLDLLTYCGNLENLKEVENNPKYKFIKGNICDVELVDSLVKQCDAIIHLAAESHVDRSILDPGPFINTNILGTTTLLNAATKHGNKRFHHVSCYDEETRALTKDGFKKYNEIKKGDVVFSINSKSKFLEEKKVNKVIIQDYQGEMIYFKSKRIDIKTTPNHRMYLETKCGNIKLEEARELLSRSRNFMPEAKWAGEDKEFTRIKNIGKLITKDLFYLCGFFIGDGFISHQIKIQESKTGLNKTEYMRRGRDNKGRFYSIRTKNKHLIEQNSYRIFFDVPRSDKARKKVEGALKILGIPFHTHQGRAGEHLYFSSKEWMDFFEQFGKGAKNKCIPRWMLTYSPRYLKYLLDGLIDSDGSKKKGSLIYYTVSEKLVSDICELAFKLNKKPLVGRRFSKSFYKNRKISGHGYYVCFSGRRKMLIRDNVSKKKYKGKIWCLNVEDNKNFIIERNGRLDFCGNTDEVFGSLGPTGFFNEKTPYDPRSPYSASKAASDHLVRAYFHTYQLPITITNCSNNYGPYQFPEKLIPLFATNLLQGKKVPLYGDGLNVRDWLYVEDHCQAIDVVLRKGKTGETYCIGGNEEKTNLEITYQVLKILGFGKDKIKYVADRKGHDLRYAIDATKIKKELGWEPKHKFNKALKETIDWYKSNQDWWKRIKSGEYLKYYKAQYGRK